VRCGCIVGGGATPGGGGIVGGIGIPLATAPPG